MPRTRIETANRNAEMDVLNAFARTLLLASLLLAASPARPGYLGDIERTLAGSGVSWSQALPAMIEGLAFQAGDVFRSSSQALAARVNLPTLQQGIAAELARNRVFQEAVLERVALLAENYSGDQLVTALSRSYNWRVLGTKRLGSVALSGDMLVFMAGAAAIGVYTQWKIDEVYTAYTGWMEAFADAAEREAYSHLVQLLVARIASGRQRLCPGVDMPEALSILRINSQLGARPYAMIIHDCSRAEKPKGELAGDWTNQNARFVVRFLEHGRDKYIGTLLDPTDAQRRAGYRAGEEVVYMARVAPQTFRGKAKVRSARGMEEWEEVSYQIRYDDLDWTYDELTDGAGDYWRRHTGD